MKKSNQVMLTAAFVAAIASYSARGQQFKHGQDAGDMTNKDRQAQDTVAHRSGYIYHSNYYAQRERRGFWGLFRRRGSTAVHRSRGFGNTMHHSYASAHS